jgi:replication factor C subunit 1
MTSYNERKSSEDDAFVNEVAGIDIFAAEVKGGKCPGDKDTETERNEELAPTPKKTAIRSKPKLRKPDVGIKDTDVTTLNGLAENCGQLPSSRKRKSVELEGHEFDIDDFGSPTKYPRSKAGVKNPTKKARSSVKNEATPESPAIQAIFDSIPIVKAPSPPPKDPNVKFNWRTGGAGNAGPAPAAGTKEIPTGAENCLAGLTFVFTGLLESISRDEGQELVKRYGGKVTGQPSSKTSYVILGSDAGPSKLEKIQKMNIKTINEDGLFELIRRLPASGGDGKAAEKNLERKRADEEKVKLGVAEMEKEEKVLAVEAKKVAQKAATTRGLSVITGASGITQASQLWTSKYAPTKTNQICGNKAQVEKIQSWLSKWPKSHKFNFELPGPDGSGKYRAIIIHGPPGIGKTTAAHLAAKLEGYDVIESNASDTRSKKLVETGLSDILNNSSLLGFFAGDGMAVDKKKKKIVLIMDEVDGMSAGDRGGVGALAKVCKKTEIPIILICNERKLPKMKPFDHVTYDIQFKRPTVEQVRSRIATICARERLSIPVQVMDALIEGSNKDIRQVINMLSATKLDQTSMNFDQGKSMSKSWEKHIVLKPWDICHKLLGSGLFAPSSRATLNDKIELYFHDHEFSYLMVQENYLSTKPFLATNQAYSPREHRLKLLELADKAAESISDGDLVDRMIHGSQQHWSLMPTHAVFSTVRPSSFMSGAMTGNSSFTQWLGNNSKYGKHARYIKEIQSHMRLRTSGDRHEIRQQYLPVLWARLIKRLEIEGKDCVKEVINLMDNYFLTRDDYEYIMELGLGPQRQDNVDLPSATKASFTRA